MPHKRRHYRFELFPGLAFSLFQLCLSLPSLHWMKNRCSRATDSSPVPLAGGLDSAAAPCCEQSGDQIGTVRHVCPRHSSRVVERLRETLGKPAADELAAPASPSTVVLGSHHPDRQQERSSRWLRWRRRPLGTRQSEDPGAGRPRAARADGDVLLREAALGAPDLGAAAPVLGWGAPEWLFFEPAKHEGETKRESAIGDRFT